MIPKATMTDQVTAHLREMILQRHWQDFLPGRERLASDLGVSHMTVSRALALLEEMGLVVSQGNGRRRRIVLPKSEWKPRLLRVGVMRYEPQDNQIYFVNEFTHQLREAGHEVVFVNKTLTDLKMDVMRVSRVVEGTEADAWLVISSAPGVLEWFAARPEPSFGLFGNISHLPIAGAGPSKIGAYTAATRRLLALGHRRITLLTRAVRRGQEHKPGSLESTFLGEIEGRGVPTGRYNLPEWEDHPEGLQRCLDSLFAITPPTAIMASEPDLFIAVLQFLGKRRIVVPDEVSLVCGDPEYVLQWCRPTIAHIGWDSAPWVRRIVSWADNIARGKRDTRKAITQAEFIDGGTIGPAPEEP